ncbi:MAG: tetratricopeptide repeat protein [Candidatus Riflebacteria bacterium]|nr:tetratricopeptide repeat protein [Candidatus Riflebacteria bacterium]
MSFCRSRTTGVALVALLTVMAVFALLPWTAARARPDPYREARNLLKSGQFGAGVKAYYRFLVRSDRLLSLAVRHQDLAKAREALSLALKNAPQDDKAALLLALVERILAQWDAAWERLDRLGRKFPQSALLTFLRGEFALSRTRGSGNEAQGWFAALKDQPAGVRWAGLAQELLRWYGVGEPPDPGLRKERLLRQAFRHFDLLERAEARQLFELICREFPDDPVAFQALAEQAMEAGQPAEAGRLLDDWRARRATSLLPPLAEARIRFAQGRYRDVVTLLGPVLQREPADEYVKRLLAEGLFQVEDWRPALPLFRELRGADPANPALLQRLAVCLESLGEAEEALQVLQEAVASYPAELFYQGEVARLQERLGRIEEAGKAYSALASTTTGPFQAFMAEKAAEMAAVLDARAREAERQRETALSGEAVALATGPSPAPAVVTPVVTVATPAPGRSKRKEEYAFLKALYE